MRILLVGEYSNVHWTLAEGLRELGHEVNVVSDGDHWKGYPRDINLQRRSLGRLDTLKYLWDIRRTWPKLAGYDVVQLINPVFLDIRAERILPFFLRLKQQNGKIFLGAFGTAEGAGKVPRAGLEAGGGILAGGLPFVGTLGQRSGN
ncbi:MAG: hypothetical protein HUK02_06850, partial [Bacteroidaceae bacterium]|nr:hypothetical protein [Bacteroidaceae bacterium]